MARDIETIELEIETLEDERDQITDDSARYDSLTARLNVLYAEADDHYDRYDGEDVMMDEEMDGDHGSALASAGFGTDEDYEHNDVDSMDFDYDQPEVFDYPEFDE